MLYFTVFFAVIAVDQISKLWIAGFLGLYESKAIVPGFFHLVHVTNTGAAFSMLADIESSWRHYFFVTVSSVAILALSVAALRYFRSNKWYVAAFSLIAGGAAGNLIDRVRLGAVVDFLDFQLAGYHWPAFNVADSCICTGAVLFLLMNFLDKDKSTGR